MFRVTQVDGDTDSPSVQKEFEKIIVKQTQQLLDDAAAATRAAAKQDSGRGSSGATGISTGKLYQRDTLVEDLEDAAPPGMVPTIAHHISLMNGHIGSGRVGSINGLPNGLTQHIPNGKPNFRTMLNESEDPVNSYM